MIFYYAAFGRVLCGAATLQAPLPCWLLSTELSGRLRHFFLISANLSIPSGVLKIEAALYPAA